MNILCNVVGPHQLPQQYSTMIGISLITDEAKGNSGNANQYGERLGSLYLEWKSHILKRKSFEWATRKHYIRLMKISYKETMESLKKINLELELTSFEWTFGATILFHVMIYDHLTETTK